MTLSLALDQTTPDFERLAELFKLMADPSRLSILWCIGQGESSVGEICTRTGLSPANVSKHLQMLRLGGIVACRKEGNSRIYFLSDPHYFTLCAQALITLSNAHQEVVSSCDE